MRTLGSEKDDAGEIIGKKEMQNHADESMSNMIICK
jgi:hypothetical protein